MDGPLIARMCGDVVFGTVGESMYLTGPFRGNGSSHLEQLVERHGVLGAKDVVLPQVYGGVWSKICHPASKLTHRYGVLHCRYRRIPQPELLLIFAIGAAVIVGFGSIFGRLASNAPLGLSVSLLGLGGIGLLLCVFVGGQLVYSMQPVWWEFDLITRTLTIRRWTRTLAVQGIEHVNYVSGHAKYREMRGRSEYRAYCSMLLIVGTEQATQRRVRLVLSRDDSVISPLLGMANRLAESAGVQLITSRSPGECADIVYDEAPRAA